MPASLFQLQQDVYWFVRLIPGLEDVAIVMQRPREEAGAVLIQDTINAALSGGGLIEGVTEKYGFVIEVKLPDAEVAEPNVPGPQMEAVLFLRLTENPLVNESETGTGLHVEDVAVLLLASLHHWQIDGRAVYADQRAIRDGDTDEDGNISFDVVIRTAMGTTPPARVLPPSITFSAGNCTLACGTAGAVIYYTTDGSTPTANAGASFYTVPFAVASGVTVRAAAWNDGTTPSGFVSKVAL